MSPKGLLIGFVIIVILITAAIAFSEVPQQIHYQGMFNDNEGTPVNDRLSITFYLYAEAESGAPLWQETRDTVEVTNGHFSVVLGDLNPIPALVFSGEFIYLTLQVAGDEEMRPRRRLVSVGYAYRALNADSLAGKSAGDFVQHSEVNSISTTMLQDDAVSADKISPNVLSSIDGVSNDGGNVDLVAGSSVSIVPDDAANTITISASGGQGGGDITAVTAGTGLNGGGDAGDVQLNVDVPLHLSADTNAVIKGSCGANYGYLGSELYGVYGQSSDDRDTYAVYGKKMIEGNWGGLGGSVHGVIGESEMGYGVLGKSLVKHGVYGLNMGTSHFGYLGGEEYSVYGSCGEEWEYGYIGGDEACVGGHTNHLKFAVLGKKYEGGCWGGLAGGELTTDQNGVVGYASEGHGVYGKAGAQYAGVYGANSDTSWGVYGINTSKGFLGYLGGSEYAVYGENTDANTYGYLGGDHASVYGTAGGPHGRPVYAVLGEKANCWGALAGGPVSEEWGVRCYSDFSHGIYGTGGIRSSGVCGETTTDWGVYGINKKGGEFGYLGGYGYGVYGKNPDNGNYAFLAGDTSAVYGYTEWSDFAVFGENPRLNCWGALANSTVLDGDGVHGYSFAGVGVWGESDNDIGLYGQGEVGIKAQGSYRAGWFIGDVHITGTLSKGGGSFKIDHPLDPANKYLQHSFVESPDMMNVYNGNVQLDASGRAVVELPDWFEALNRDFRYQLTAIGAPGPDLYIAEEIQDNRFVIAGGQPGSKVSWQITGIRQDPWAQKNRIQVETDKTGDEIGTLLHSQ